MRKARPGRQRRRAPGRLPRPDLRRAVGDAAGVQAGAVRPARARVHRRRPRGRTRSAPPSTSTPPRCCSSRSRARPASTRRRRGAASPRARPATAVGAALVFDEVQTGMGRTGTPVGLRADRRSCPTRSPAPRDSAAGYRSARSSPAQRLADVLAARRPRLDVRRRPGRLPGGARGARHLLATRSCSSSVRELGERLRHGLAELPFVRAVRGRGLMVGADLDARRPRAGPPRAARAAAGDQRHRPGDDPPRAAAGDRGGGGRRGLPAALAAERRRAPAPGLELGGSPDATLDQADPATTRRALRDGACATTGRRSTTAALRPARATAAKLDAALLERSSAAGAAPVAPGASTCSTSGARPWCGSSSGELCGASTARPARCSRSGSASGLRGYERELGGAASGGCSGELGSLADARRRWPTMAWRARSAAIRPRSARKVTVPLAPDQRADAAAAAVLRALAAVIEAQPRRHDRGSRPGVPARPPGLGPPLPGGPAPAEGRVPAGRARASPPRVPLAAAASPASCATSTSSSRSSASCASGWGRSTPATSSPSARCSPSAGEAAREAVAADAPGPADSTRLLRDWSALLEDLVELPLGPAASAPEPIAALAGERIAKLYRRMVRDGRRIDADSPRRGAPRPAQAGQGAPLPARAVRRRAVRRRRRRPAGQDAQGAPGRARPPPGPPRADRPAARARPPSSSAARGGRAGADRRRRRAARAARGRGRRARRVRRAVRPLRRTSRCAERCRETFASP